MTIWATELLQVTAGVLSVSYLTVEDDDRFVTSEEADAIFTLDGELLTATPVIEGAIIDFVWVDGVAAQAVTMHFSYNGSDYYFLSADKPADAFTSVSNLNPLIVVSAINYTTYSGVLDGGKSYRGDALVLTTPIAGGATTVDVQFVSVYDDDTRIEFNGENGAPDSEDGGDAAAVMGDQQADVAFNITDAGAGDTTMVLVEVAYTGVSGAGTFEAIRYGFRFGTNDYVYYIPRNGTVDLADVLSVTGETVLPTSLDGDLYTAYGLNTVLDAQFGDAADNVMFGDLANDRLVGLGGDDTLLGSVGGDKLDGGAGDDTAYGGIHDDELTGGSGVDKLYGGIGADTGDGGSGNDKLYGGWGADILIGGSGIDKLYGGEDADVLTGGTDDDKLYGGADADDLKGEDNDDMLYGGGGADVLDGGDGEDTLKGAGGADTFVITSDGATDTISDYVDDSDLIDVNATFGSLTFTDIAPGEVHVTHSGETLIIISKDGLLTSADLTNADFI